MLFLKNINKSYVSGDTKVTALDDVTLTFRENEFVAILGPSGSGKTTLLNIVGGLDQYTSGDLVINGKSTKKFKDADWDTYRNHSVGFVFQSYNLIPHQSVLSNVELALTLSGISKKVRRERAREALIKVGLGDQLNKKPNQMSGGQMQRVAIARALVNNPDILLADEPTGALDSVTSVQIMELLKEVSKDRLVIMVTHNPELADTYANRIVNLKDGKIVSDTNPFDGSIEEDKKEKIKKPSMSLFTALTLSLNNLMTKKARTFLTSFAGSIGIIGIALILALSSGVNAYINQVQEETLISYPIQIQAEQLDMSSLISGLMGSGEKRHDHPKDKVYASSVMYDLANAMNSTTVIENDLGKLKNHFESGKTEIKNHVRTIQYLYSVPMNVYAKTPDGKYQKSDIMEVFSSLAGDSMNQMSTTSMMGQMSMGFSSYNTWAEILPGMNGELISDIFTSQYTPVYGEWPKDKSEIVLVLDKNYEITDITLHALGLVSTETLLADTIAAQRGDEVEQEIKSYSFEEISEISFKLIGATDYYADADSDGIWEDLSENEDSMNVIVSKGLDLKISCIVAPNEDANISSGGASLYYTRALTEYLIDYTNASEIKKAQDSTPETDVFTGLPFVLEEEAEPTVTQKAQEMKDYFKALSLDKKAEMYEKILSVPDKVQTEETIKQYMAQFPDRASLEKMIFDQYSVAAGIDEESIETFIAEYSDDELRKMVEDSIRTMLSEQQKQTAQQMALQVVSTPTETELQPFMAEILKNLPDRATKMGFIMTEYTKTTAMSQQSVMQFLMTKSDAEIDSMVNTLAIEKAKALYAPYAGKDVKASAFKLATAFDAYYMTLSDEKLVEAYETCMPPKTSSSTLKDNLKKLGAADLSSPSSINIYVSTFADKDVVKDIITQYNDSVPEEEKITYTDLVAVVMSSVTTIINAITYVLIAFVSISLVVSSIMIGIITYISVLERTKEIGILRAIGASKKDVSRVFNAETLIIGFISGAMGILFTVLICIPANAIIRAVTNIPTLTAYLPWQGAVILLLISILLTMIAGLFPSKLAAKKDPVVALRSE